MSLGPIMLDLIGPELSHHEEELLRHPLVGGVILFSRNYQNPDQISHLCRQIHELRDPPLLIAVDHEGGRVQRFRDGFTALPPCACYGEVYDEDRNKGLNLVQQAGWLMAVELLAVGVDFSLAPVLDLNRGVSKVIGDRGFHRIPDVTTALAKRFMYGMRDAGMASVGKHFPGHGSITEDSHDEIPVDLRAYQDIIMSDLIPFERLIHTGLPAIMPAHVIYRNIDDKPAGYSARWLQEVLRKQLGFQGVIFSDDISMAAAGIAGNHVDRARAAIKAGCDMVLICNNQQAAGDVIEKLDLSPSPASYARLMRMHGRGHQMTLSDLKKTENWRAVAEVIAMLEKTPELALGDDEIKS